jgi:hypothetical protein
MSLPEEVTRLLGLADRNADQVRLDASTIETLSLGLRELAIGLRGWIDFEDYRRLFEGEKPARGHSRWHVGTVPPGPTWWVAGAQLDAWRRNAQSGFEWTWTSPPALALTAFSSRHRCTPLRAPREGRFYFTKDERR